MKKAVFLLLSMMISIYVPSVSAKKLGDLYFPDKVQIAGTSTPLQLNGVGHRTKFFFKIYAGALYTVKKVHSRNAVQALTGPDRVVMHFIYSEVSRDKLVAAWQEGFQENNTAAQLKALAPEITQFNAMFPSLKKGDIVVLDYLPGKGTRVTIKGKVKGTIKGKDFNRALLDVWLGNKPADEDLKQAMLGNDAEEEDY